MIYSTIFVGDPHPVVEELDDVRALIRAIEAFARDTKARRIVFLGDQHHTHSVVRLEVMGLWKEAFRLLGRHREVVALVGNHDRSSCGRYHAMAAYPEVRVIEKPEVFDSTLWVPHMADPRDFESLCQQYAYMTDLVVCHQLFDGSVYENGYYAGEEGASIDAVPQAEIISGHIHKPQRLGKLWYPGAPRWRTASDANEKRAIWFVDGDTRIPYDTAQCCRRIILLDDSPEKPADVPAPGPLLDVRVEVRGPAEYVVPRTAALRARGVRVTPFRTDSARIEVRESDGIVPAFVKYLAGYEGRRGTPRPRLAEIVKERMGIAA